jgi:hypothetical protein
MCWEQLSTKDDIARVIEVIKRVQEGEQDQEFTDKEAAAYLKVSLTTFRQWCNPRKQANPIRPVNEDKPPKYSKFDCIKFLKQHSM